jgi:hypothetical protein
MQTRYVLTIAIALFFTTTTFISVGRAQTSNPTESNQPPIERVHPLPATDNPDVARIYATAAIVQAYLQNRKTPFESEEGLVRLVRQIKDALK